MGHLKLEMRLKKEWTEVLMQKEMLWMQKSRIDWLCFGDKNTCFFQTSTVVRRRRNKIEPLRGEDGDWVNDKAALNNMAVKYYSELFISDSAAGGAFIIGQFPHFEQGVWEEMGRVVMVEETRRSLQKMGSYKALGPDGYPAIFYIKTWHITGGDLYSFVRDAVEGKAVL